MNREKPLIHSALAIGALFLLLCLHSPTQAHSGPVALAIPLEGITVDGNLSDWPAGMRQYPIAIHWRDDPPQDAEDFRGSFCIGYSAPENALYLAVEIRDESTAIDTTEGGHWRSDGCQITVDVAHGKEDPPGQAYYLQGNTHGTWGDKVDRADFSAAVNRARSVHRYEWRIDIGRKTAGQTRLRPGMPLGLDVVLRDWDEDGSSSWMAWGTGPHNYAFYSMGDVVLVEGEEEKGRLSGQLTWEDGTGVARSKVRIHALDSESLWVTLKTDRQGNYAAELPTGMYRITSEIRSADEREIDVDILPKKKSKIEKLIVPAAKGQTVKFGAGRRTASKGKSVPAGEGQWRERWQTLGVADGLPDASVTAIFQDRDGNLWLATNGGGVTRYDGEEFTTFTTSDGLGGYVVSSIAQGRDGTMWFGTGGWVQAGGGLSSYDGREMVTFSTEDGLPGNNVLCLLVDRRGDLWIGTDAGAARYDDRQEADRIFTRFTVADGLLHDYVKGMSEGKNGDLWFGTWAGASRYDGQKFENFTLEDGLGHLISCIGKDRAGHLWFGSWTMGISRYDGQKFKHFRKIDGLVDDGVYSLAIDPEGNLWFGTTRGVSRYDGKNWKSFTTDDGLAHQTVASIFQDGSGDMWFGTGWWTRWGIAGGNGVSRFAREELTIFTRENGLPNNGVMALCEDRQGRIWFGTWGGACWFDGREIRTLDGLQGNAYSIVEDRKGNMWFATESNGVYRYDGRTLTNFTAADGFINRGATKMVEDRQGDMWFGTVKGVFRYDGEAFARFDTTDGLHENNVWAVFEDRQGNMWFGTGETIDRVGGVSRYDGQDWETFAPEPGLAHRMVTSILQDRDSRLWFSTWGRGVSRYDGVEFVDFTTADGLSHNRVMHVMEDAEGHLWFSTWGRGVSRYDGRVFQNLLGRDGLPNDVVHATLQDSRGDIWIATEGGVARFHPHSSPPPVRITDVVTNRSLGPLAEIRLPASQDHLAFEFLGTSFKTRPNQMVYLYQLEGYDPDWRQTRKRQVAYHDLPTGEYRFRVQAIDRDLTYSEQPAEVRVAVHPPYAQLALIGGLGLALVGFIAASTYGLKRRRDLRRAEQALMRELEEELQTAHDMQMSLMPTEPPHIEGFDIAGKCLTANHVGGDFFQYFQQDGKLSICLADVTGHAMEAAIPVVMFNGILESQMEQGGSLEDLFFRLNRSLHRTRIDGRTFVCFTMAEIDRARRTLRLTNGGCPYPYHYIATTGEVAELQIDAYPLGVRPDTAYPVVELSLEPDDYLVFCSDGIPEAAGPNEEIFGFERTTEAIRRGCVEKLSAEKLIIRLLDDVRTFTGEATQEDDMTVVVLQVEA